MTRAAEERHRSLLRARDLIDRRYADPLDVPLLARTAHLSPAYFAREFRRVFGESPHRYLQRRRVERAMFLLRSGDEPVLTICHRVGFTSLGTFGRLFRDIVGCSPTAYRLGAGLGARLDGPAPTSFGMRWLRPTGARAGPGSAGTEKPAGSPAA